MPLYVWLSESQRNQDGRFICCLPSGERNINIRIKFSEIQKQLWASGKYKNRKKRRRIYSQEIINEILESSDKGEYQVEIAKILNIPRTSVQGIIYGRLQ